MKPTYRKSCAANLQMLSDSVVNDKPVCGFRSFLAKITKFTKNIWELVIENVIILGHLMADTSSK